MIWNPTGLGTKEITNAQYAAFLNELIFDDIIKVKKEPAYHKEYVLIEVPFQYGPAIPDTSLVFLHSLEYSDDINSKHSGIYFDGTGFSILKGREEWPVLNMGIDGSRRFCIY